MKRMLYNKFMLLFLCGSLAFVSCKDDEMVSGEVLSISDFYPSIVMEGTKITVVGSAMETVSEVKFPGGVSSTDITKIDNNTIEVIAPASISEKPEPLMIKAGDNEAYSKQVIRLAEPKFMSYQFSDKEGAKTNTTITIIGNDLLLVSAVKFSNENGDEKTVDAMNMTRKSNDAIKFVIPDNAPTGEGVNVSLVFDNATTMVLPSIDIAEGEGGGPVIGDVILFEGENVIANWSNLTVTSFYTSYMNEDDVLTVYFKDCSSGAQKAYRDNSTWSPLIDGADGAITQEEINQGYFTLTITSDAVEKLKTAKLVLSGDGYTITKITLRTLIKDNYCDPVSPDALMLSDFEGHTSASEPSWTGGVVLDYPQDDNGNTYLRLSETVEGDIWLVNCSHHAIGTIPDMENYVIKFDLMIESGTVGASQSAMQYVLASDKWIWVGTGFFPESTDGKWITVTREISVSGELSFEGKNNGMYGSNVPAGICIDNFRLEHK